MASGVVQRAGALYARAAGHADWLRSPLLLALRLYWGWQFAVTGWGKLTNIERTAGFFGGLGIPAPTLNAYMAGATECFGGALLFVGLFSRAVSFPLVFTMVVAYLTAHGDSVRAIYSNPDGFVSQAPFQFLLTALIVLAFGPGALSLDALIAKLTGREGVGGGCPTRF